MKPIILASDHGGFTLKNELVAYLESIKAHPCDIGIHTEEAVDYPDIAGKACRQFLNGEYEFGILVCGTGIGISIAANKIPGIRCALPQDPFAATMAKEHNNANFVAFGGRVDYRESPFDMLKAFMDSHFLDDTGRHAHRVKKIHELETAIFNT